MQRHSGEAAARSLQNFAAFTSAQTPTARAKAEEDGIPSKVCEKDAGINDN